MSKTKPQPRVSITDLYRLDGKDSPGCAQFLMACSISWPCSLPTSRLFLSSRAPPAPIPTTTGSLCAKRHAHCGHWHARSTVSSCGPYRFGIAYCLWASALRSSRFCAALRRPMASTRAIGAIMVGGLIRGACWVCSRNIGAGLFLPIVAAVVVTSIGFSLLRLVPHRLEAAPGLRRFRIAAKISRSAASRLSCLVFQIMAKGKKPSSFRFLFGLVIG